MKEISLFAELEYSNTLTNFTALEAGIWRSCLYADGPINKLPFMADTFNRKEIKVNNVIIDQEELTQCDDLAALRALGANEGGWVNGGSIIYIRFKEWNTPFVHYSHRYGILIGFTDGSPVLLNGMMYRSGLLSAPKVEHSSDALSYDKMKFNSAKIDIDNTNGQFDNVDTLFGNEFNLHIGIPDNTGTITGLKTLAQYFISNITVGLAKASFQLKDKRERISAKIPNKRYTAADYPRIDDEYLDKDMQEVYGRCYGVPGVCLEGKAIYQNGTSGATMGQYQFRFASQITRVDRIQVKMTDGEMPKPDPDPDDPNPTIKLDGWTTVYRRAASGDPAFENWSGWKPGVTPGIITTENLNRGVITLSTELAKQGGQIENQVNEVRMDGVFINKTTPLDIIKDIMAQYAGTAFNEAAYYKDGSTYEIEKELGPLNHEIGVMFDKSISVYEAVEKLQGGCVCGFQFQVYENKFTARLDNPNRAEGEAVHYLEILNLDEVEIDWNADLYGTCTNIEYAHDYGENEGKRWIDMSKRQDILDLHRVEKEWSASTLLAHKQDAELKSNILLEDFAVLRPIIRNIQLAGEKWFGLRVYDIRSIDLRIPGEATDKYPQNLIRLIELVNKDRIVVLGGEPEEYIILADDSKVESRDKREFAGKLRCQILRTEVNTQTGITTIDVRVRERSNVWAA
ncbi:MAG TPA: hypothetical protein DEQ14_03070 [Treponema sp.]|nr:hypothetical protein [Treponema sp.]